MERKPTNFGKFFKKGNTHTLEITLDTIEFKEGDIFYFYAPALDILGYGNTQQEAKNSWEVMMKEYFAYSLKKNTFVQDLQRHGWTVQKKHLIPPNLSWILQNNDQASEVYNNHNFTKTSRPVKMPAVEYCA